LSNTRGRKGSKVETRRVDLRSLSPKDRALINEILVKSASATVFHTIEWNRLLIDVLNLQNSTLLTIIDGSPTGLYCFYKMGGHRCWSSAINVQSTYGAPISINSDTRVIVELLKGAEKLQPTADFQIWTPPNYDVSPFKKLGYACIEMYTPVLNLQLPEEELWSRLHRDKRSKIRKAIKNNVVVVEADASSLEIYLKLVTYTLGGAGIRLLPKSFYWAVLEQLVPQNLAKLFLAKYNGESVSGTIILYFKDTAYGWDIGWNREFSHVAPNDLLVWEAARRARQEGYKYFDLLRIETDRLPGIAQWKKTFGGEILNCYSLRKTMPGFYIWQGIRTLLTNPRKVVNKLIRKRTD
jgi:hypothetical protein